MGIFCLSFSCNLIGYFKQALKSDWFLFVNVPFSLAGKKMRFRAKNSARIARITSDFKMDVINSIISLAKTQYSHFASLLREEYKLLADE